MMQMMAERRGRNAIAGDAPGRERTSLVTDSRTSLVADTPRNACNAAGVLQRAALVRT